MLKDYVTVLNNNEQIGMRTYKDSQHLSDGRQLKYFS